MARILVTGGSGFIGSHLLSHLAERGHELLSVDIGAPTMLPAGVGTAHVDIKNRDRLVALFRDFEPQKVVHLAARTDLDGTTLDAYADNTEGTANVVAAAKATPGVDRLVVTSTQYVVRPGVVPESDTSFEAYSAYGQSKVRTEEITRAEAPPVPWTIIRPTSIWGPRHPFLPQRIWYYIAKGIYIHPGREPIRRAYAYVGVVVEQITAILDAAPEVVAGRVFYVGETPIDFLEWTNAFSMRLRGRPVRVVPRTVWRSLATVGDVVPRFPMNSDRFERMTTDDQPSIEATYAALGQPSIDFETAVDTTVAWLREHWAAQGQPELGRPAGR